MVLRITRRVIRVLLFVSRHAFYLIPSGNSAGKLISHVSNSGIEGVCSNKKRPETNGLLKYILFACASQISRSHFSFFVLENTRPIRSVLPVDSTTVDLVYSLNYLIKIYPRTSCYLVNIFHTKSSFKELKKQ